MKAPIRNIIHIPQGLGIMEAAVPFRLSQLLKVSTVLVSQVLALQQACVQSERTCLARLVTSREHWHRTGCGFERRTHPAEEVAAAACLCARPS